MYDLQVVLFTPKQAKDKDKEVDNNMDRAKHTAKASQEELVV
jgi:hypothetical protein